MTLTAGAPTGGAVVQLQSGNIEIARVPASVTVAAAATTATFAIDASSVPTATNVDIDATYAGIKKSATLRVTLPTVRASFTVSSPTKGANACKLISDNNLDCVLDASASDGRLTRWIWTLTSEKEVTETRSGTTWTPDISIGCSFITGATSNTDSQGRYVNITIKLQVEDRDGTRSSAVSRTVKLYTEERCGFSA